MRDDQACPTCDGSGRLQSPQPSGKVREVPCMDCQQEQPQESRGSSSTEEPSAYIRQVAGSTPASPTPQESPDAAAGESYNIRREIEEASADVAQWDEETKRDFGVKPDTTRNPWCAHARRNADGGCMDCEKDTIKDTQGQAPESVHDAAAEGEWRVDDTRFGYPDVYNARGELITTSDESDSDILALVDAHNAELRRVRESTDGRLAEAMRQIERLSRERDELRAEISAYRASFCADHGTVDPGIDECPCCMALRLDGAAEGQDEDFALGMSIASDLLAGAKDEQLEIYKRERDEARAEVEKAQVRIMEREREQRRENATCAEIEVDRKAEVERLRRERDEYRGYWYEDHAELKRIVGILMDAGCAVGAPEECSAAVAALVQERDAAVREAARVGVEAGAAHHEVCRERDELRANPRLCLSPNSDERCGSCEPCQLDRRVDELEQERDELREELKAIEAAIHDITVWGTYGTWREAVASIKRKIKEEVKQGVIVSHKRAEAVAQRDQVIATNMELRAEVERLKKAVVTAQSDGGKSRKKLKSQLSHLKKKVFVLEHNATAPSEEVIHDRDYDSDTTRIRDVGRHDDSSGDSGCTVATDQPEIVDTAPSEGDPQEETTDGADHSTMRASDSTRDAGEGRAGVTPSEGVAGIEDLLWEQHGNKVSFKANGFWSCRSENAAEVFATEHEASLREAVARTEQRMHEKHAAHTAALKDDWKKEAGERYTEGYTDGQGEVAKRMQAKLEEAREFLSALIRGIHEQSQRPRS